MNSNRAVLLRQEYVSRINRVQDYIDGNISEEFSLIELSKIANFSPYHFHRIFYSITGETLFQYIQRIRLEKAATLLVSNKKMPVMQIALNTGFSNQASFAKAFHNYFNMSPTRLRKEICIIKKDEDLVKSNTGKVLADLICYNNAIRNEQYSMRLNESDLDYEVEVLYVQDMDVVYIRHIGPYKQDAELFKELFGKLTSWAHKNNIINPSETKSLTLYHDNPNLTDDNKLRISVCLSVSDEIEVDGETGYLKVEGGKYAVGHFKLNPDQYQSAWSIMYEKWLPESGYQPDDRMSYELYKSNTSENSQKHIVDIYVPIKPL